MPMPSTVDRIPADIRAKLQELLADPRVTMLEATARINEILEAEGHPERLSKSAVGRAAQRWSQMQERISRAREMGELFIAKVGAAPQGQTGLIINEILRTLAFDLSERLLDADLSDPEALPGIVDQVKGLALAVQRLEQAATTNVRRDAEIRRQALAEVERAVEERAADAGPMSADDFRRIIRECYGV